MLQISLVLVAALKSKKNTSRTSRFCFKWDNLRCVWGIGVFNYSFPGDSNAQERLRTTDLEEKELQKRLQVSRTLLITDRPC